MLLVPATMFFHYLMSLSVMCDKIGAQGRWDKEMEIHELVGEMILLEHEIGALRLCTRGPE